MFGFRTNCAAAMALWATAMVPASAEELPILEPNEEGVIFVLGEEDGSRRGYQNSGWDEVDEHSCSIGVDCLAKPFPSHLHASSAKSKWASTAVERDVITFNLGRPYEVVILRLVRAGAETISVRLDQGDEIHVTKSMMEPQTFEHSPFGAYDLELGSLSQGEHVLRLGVADDGEGNGRFGWDAIILRTDSH